MLHLFLQLQATSSGPHPIHTGRTFFLPGKTNKLKMMCLYQKPHPSPLPFVFRWFFKLRFFRDHFLLESSHSTDFVVQRKKTKIGLGGYFEARHHGFNFINLRKTIQHGPPSSKSVGMRMAWGLRWGASFSKKRMVAKEKNMSNKQTKATKVKHNHFDVWEVQVMNSARVFMEGREYIT